MDQLFSLIGQVLVFGGGGIALGFGLFQWLGKKWIESRFDRQLKELEFKQNEALARLRVEIESVLSGVLKIQEREFEVLPTTWRLLHTAYEFVNHLVSPFKEVEDVGTMVYDDLEEFLNSMSWPRSNVRALLNSRQGIDRQNLFNRFKTNALLKEVQRSLVAYEECISANAIFYPHDLKDKLDLLRKIMFHAVWLVQDGLSTRNPMRQIKAHERMEEEAAPAMREVESIIRARLESHMRASSRGCDASLA